MKEGVCLQKVLGWLFLFNIIPDNKLVETSAAEAVR